MCAQGLKHPPTLGSIHLTYKNKNKQKNKKQKTKIQKNTKIQKKNVHASSQYMLPIENSIISTVCQLEV
jgi:hypothetical protein